ncbi:30S ribosomal protein S16 [Psychroflexus maritimus]|uniref:Small ribosomal subunit protein bS16 n=1 Tax=Psychroflexus maritimus TaxID=2714865 RepID=A0A967AE45_9FLAO|nr:30S ribosomal protein S16 [Psychroflexus maritimus]NGZ90624.1 30S ribosomal protein S16 [Psychroflexus maritimus]
MPVKIRLQRHGKKGKPFFWIVAADGRAKRDGKFLEKLGIYNPTTNPATIELNVDGAVKWMRNGAQPTDTAKRILSYKGAMLKKHLLAGVDKGALTEEQANEKFEAWLKEKEDKVFSKTQQVEQSTSEAKQKALAAEKEANAKRKAAVDATLAEEAAEKSTEETTEEVAEATTEETPVEETTAQADEKKEDKEA